MSIAKRAAQTGLAVGLAMASPVNAITTLNFFSIAAYNPVVATMNATLGVTGRPTVDFETAAFLPGLSIVLTGSVPTTTETSLPALFDGNAFSALTADQYWDGTRTASNALGNLPNSTTSPTNIANTIAFNYSPGTLSFGIGLSNFQSTNSALFPLTQHKLLVNGVDLGVLETLAGGAWTPGLSRNAYLRVDSDVPINSVAFANVQTTGQQDFLMFDHLTVAVNAGAVPEPTTWTFMLLGFAAIGSAMRRRFDVARGILPS